MRKIATIYTPFKEKFGIPRQGGVIKSVGRIVFESEFSRMEAFRGLEGYSHVWVLWEFSENVQKEWSPTVRPPRLGGNKRVGVFSTRSPFRPNPIGMTAVKLLEINFKDNKVELVVEGVDMLDGTPVYDVKPYVPHADMIVDAKGGFSDEVKDYRLEVVFDEEVFNDIDDKIKLDIINILSSDPRPSYHNDKSRVYGMNFFGYEVKFNVDENAIYIKSIFKATN